MNTYPIYRSIRRRAQIFGLPVSLFALQMVTVLGSLLVIIFSFGAGIVLGALLLNLGLYVALLCHTRTPFQVSAGHPYPSYISNQQSTDLFYEGN